ncbi:hypothetical protein DID78_03320 [Candidatus Marinamargulisbacteria bacterium SCGC AG-343-D04]|nr:hypothetical protein DID78_03320 [Candidatus Marinamargulisbacteria bacterium SCGC AG-343-D04]
MFPFHYRLDCQIWFEAMSDYQQHPWVRNFIGNLLMNDAHAFSLIKSSPFTSSPPNYFVRYYITIAFQVPKNVEKINNGGFVGL